MLCELIIELFVFRMTYCLAIRIVCSNDEEITWQALESAGKPCFVVEWIKIWIHGFYLWGELNNFVFLFLFMVLC